MISKLSFQLASLYSAIAEGMGQTVLKGQFEKSWIELAKLKQKYYLTMAYHQKAKDLDSQNKYGEMISYLKVADMHVDELLKVAANFAYYFPKFSVSSESQNNHSAVSGKLEDICKSLSAMIKEKLTGAIKDNDMIYHETVPAIETLPGLEKLNAVKTADFSEVCPSSELNQVIGPDLFSKLIPMSVHESNSLYSEEKDKIARREKEKVQLADDDLEATLASLNVSKLTARIKEAQNLKKNIDEMPGELIDLVESHQSRAGIDVNSMVSQISQLKPAIDELLGNISLLLCVEQQECEKQRVSWFNDREFMVLNGLRCPRYACLMIWSKKSLDSRVGYNQPRKWMLDGYENWIL